MSKSRGTVYVEVKPGVRNVTVSLGPTFAIGVYYQTINTSRNNVVEYTTHQTIFMIPFISLTIQRFVLPE